MDPSLERFRYRAWLLTGFVLFCLGLGGLLDLFGVI